MSKHININYTVKYKNDAIYVPLIIMTTLNGEPFSNLISCLNSFKHEINNILRDNIHNTCILCQIDVYFECYRCFNCNRCIFKPGIIKRIGIGTFKKLLSLSVNENYWGNKDEKFYNLIKK